MKIYSIEVKDIEDLKRQVPAFLGKIVHKVVCLEGDLGAGKTTLVKLLCEEIGISESVTSPTYSLINLYKNERISVAHMDLYRLKSLEECLDIGIEDYLLDQDICFIEWPEIAMDLLPSKIHLIQIVHSLGEKRIIRLSEISNEQ